MNIKISRQRKQLGQNAKRLGGLPAESSMENWTHVLLKSLHGLPLHQGSGKKGKAVPSLPSSPLQPLIETTTKPHVDTLVQFMHQLSKQPETSEEVLLRQYFERLANQPGTSPEQIQHGSGFDRQYDPDNQSTPPSYACKKIDSSFRLACPVYNENEETTCIDDTQLCDGMSDCPNGDDENKTVCMFYTMIRYTINKLTQTMFEKLQRH
ncbi:I isoform X2 [Octopus vulgaris]|uniref:I isoform X2 n=1 Tax=Octopus vulgaris TaxID=6645 RepID=A0AA36F998_OCTVU|nr:I isoform X2 [Octopus vulgaris]